MSRRVLSVGQCVPDNATIKHFLCDHFDVQIDLADLPADTLELLKVNHYDLVLINRKLDQDYSDGIEIISAMKSDSSLAGIPVMLITNFPDHQQQAVEVGAEYGFGKSGLDDPDVIERLKPFLD